MDAAAVLHQCLAMLAGELRDSTGAAIVPAATMPVVVDPVETQRSTVMAALASGRRVVVPVEPAPSGNAARVGGWLTARRRVNKARRWLTATGATRVRTFAAVPNHDALFLIYELGGTAQSYVDRHIVLRSQGAPWWNDAAKAGLSRLIGADVSVALIVVVGERR